MRHFIEFHDGERWRIWSRRMNIEDAKREKAWGQHLHPEWTRWRIRHRSASYETPQQTGAIRKPDH